MSSNVHDILTQALKLPGEERIELAEAILSSVAPPDSLPFDDEWIAEAKRRAARIDSGEGKVSGWPEVQERAWRAVRRPAGG